MRNFRFRSEKSQSKKLVFIFLFIVVGIPLFLVNAAEAQIKENIERELEKTDAVIGRAKEAVLESRNPKAENLLKMADKLQERARNEFRMIRYRLAVELTLKARTKAYEAIGFTKKDEENENLVLKAIERTDQIISKAKEVGKRLENRRIFSLLEMATNNQQKAKEFFKEHKLKMALKFTLKAREMAQKVLNLANKEKRLDRLAEKELERTDRFIERASVIIQESQNRTANELLNQARSLQEKAWDIFARKRFAKAIKNSQKARELVQKALRLVEQNVTPQMVENAIQQNERLIVKVEEKTKVGVSSEAISIFEKGLSHQSKAKEYYREGKFKAALAEAKVAHRLITKALEMIQENGM
jgi:tetratricopeptide (TPR) repeat protein